MKSIEVLFGHYGYLFLLGGLLVELIGFPTPGEIMMGYCGYLIYQGKMNYIYSIVIALLGVIIGITFSYWIGYILGYPFFNKYGKYFHLKPEKLDKTTKWFERYGKRIIFFAYFIPGVRHVTGYFSGISRISYKKFAINAYLGAALWVITFVSLGKALGPKWDRFHKSMGKYGIIGGIILLVIIVSYYLIKYYQTQIISRTLAILNTTLHIFHSMGKMRIVIALTAGIFLSLVAYMIGLIQDFFGNEFIQFDTLVSYVVKSIYSSKWTFAMKAFMRSTSTISIIIIITISIIWIHFKEVNRILETIFLFITVVGGEILAIILQYGFHRSGPLGVGINGYAIYTFPSYEAMMSIVAYGFLVFLLSRNASRIWVKTAAIIIGIGICAFTGQSVLFFQNQYPSDVLAGYTFGGVWLCLNIILLEIFRILPKLSGNENLTKI